MNRLIKIQWAIITWAIIMVPIIAYSNLSFHTEALVDDLLLIIDPDHDGAMSDTDLTLNSVTTAATTSPGVTLKDSDAPGADKEIATFQAEYVDGADGSENADVLIYTWQGGSKTLIAQFDESDDQWETSKVINSSGGFIGTLTGSSTSVGGANGVDSDDYTDGSIFFEHLATATLGIVTKTTAVDYTIGTTDAKEAYGGIIYVTGASTITVPAVAERMAFTIVTIGAVAVSLDVSASDRLYLDGTALSDGDKATNTSTTGDMLVCTYESSSGFYCASGSPDGDHWTDGN